MEEFLISPVTKYRVSSEEYVLQTTFPPHENDVFFKLKQNMQCLLTTSFLSKEFNLFLPIEFLLAHMVGA